MPSFFLAMVAAALATLGGREATRVAQLSASLGPATGLLVACWMAAAASCTLVAWLGAGVAADLAPDAKGMLVAIVLFIAALELAFLRDVRTPNEPTRSFGAILLVLTVSQLTGAAGFLVLALAAATGSPMLAGGGGTLGCLGVLSLAWRFGKRWEQRLPRRAIRLVCAGAFVFASVITALNSRGLIG